MKVSYWLLFPVAAMAIAIPQTDDDGPGGDDDDNNANVSSSSADMLVELLLIEQSRIRAPSLSLLPGLLGRLCLFLRPRRLHPSSDATATMMTMMMATTAAAES